MVSLISGFGFCLLETQERFTENTNMYNKGIKFFEVSKNKFRLVTHSGISHDDVKYVIKMFNSI